MSVKFSVAYLALLIAAAAISQAMQVKGGASFAIATTLGASFFAAWLFARQTNRPPTPEEVKAFASRAFVGACLVSLALVVGFLALFSPAHEARAVFSLFLRPTYLLIALVAFLVLGGIQYLVIRLSFGWFAKLAAKGTAVEA